MKNAHLTEYSSVKCLFVHLFTKAIGVQVKISGIPFGSKAKVTTCGPCCADDKAVARV